MFFGPSLGAIAQYPLAFTEVEPEFRQCVMPRFPYSLIYRVRGSTIVVVAVHHQRRDPDAWRARTRLSSTLKCNTER